MRGRKVGFVFQAYNLIPTLTAEENILPGHWWTAADRWQAIHVAVFHTACTLAYIVAYSALEHRSPSMTLLVAVADAAAAGCSPDELRGLLRRQPWSRCDSTRWYMRAW